MPSLVVNGQGYTAQQLLGWNADQAGSGLSENALAAITFASQWLAGEQRFALTTSGSTGEPKPIHLTRSQMEASARATAAVLGLVAGQKVLVCLPTRYIAGRMMLVRGLVLGLPLLVVEPAADPFAALPQEWRPDFASFVPLQMQTVLTIALEDPSDSPSDEERERSSRYRRLLDATHAILLGGGPVSEPLHEQVRRLSAPVYHTYGMTETATHIALRRLNGSEAEDAFRPLPGVHLMLDGRGCLAIRGPMTAGAWVQTNDLAELREDNSFVWRGRWDNVINSGGIKVHSESVEAAVETVRALHPELAWAGRRLAVAGTPDERLGQVVTLVVEGAPFSPEQEAEISGWLRARLDRFEAPRRFAYLPHLPETPTGKIDRAQLWVELSEP